MTPASWGPLTSHDTTVPFGLEYPRRRDIFLVPLILTGFFGAFTIIAPISVYVLMKKASKARTTILLALAIVILYASTSAFWAIEIYAFSQFAGWDFDNPIIQLQGTQSTIPRGLKLRIPVLQSCIPTILLLINVLIGDGIVWWRVLVLWKGNRVVTSLCIVLLLASVVLGLIETTMLCISQEIAIVGPPSPFDPLEVATVSFLTNLIATVLIWIKAWSHSRFMKKQLGPIWKASQVQRVLLLFVESGVLYTLVWAFVVVEELDAGLLLFGHLRRTNANEGLAEVSLDFVSACVVPIIGIYPTLIILLVALKQSYWDAYLASRTAFEASLAFNNPEFPELNNSLDHAHAPYSTGVADTDVLPVAKPSFAVLRQPHAMDTNHCHDCPDP
ncbi:hypothetical protein C8Q70DRAFT_80337 [Cubamyces menziesii]|nr:hypothetical protein C8Q70DRAFT_80337 [Cubamyces menziesii]